MQSDEFSSTNRQDLPPRGSALPVPYHYPAHVEAWPTGSPEEEEQLPLMFYWIQILRHRRRIAVAVVILTVLAAVYTLRVPKQYESVATIRVELDNPANQVSPTMQQNDSSDEFDSLIATEMENVTSRSVLLEAVRSHDLASKPALKPRLAPHASSSAIEQAVLNNVAAAVKVTRPLDTRNIQIHFRSTDPRTAADGANAVASALIEHEFTTRLNALTYSSEWMTRQLEDVRARLERSDRALVEYQRKNNFFDTGEGREGPMNQRLAELNQQLSAAQADRLKTEADLNTVRSGDLNALLVTDHGQFIMPVFTNLRTAQNNFENVRSHLGPANPVYRRAQRELQQAEQDLALAKTQLTRQIETEYERARQRQQLVSQALAQFKAEVDAYNAKAIQYDVLKRDNESNRRLYDNLQQRIKEANLVVGFHNQDLRISDPAAPSANPVYPNVRGTVALTFLLSLIAACAIAIVAGVLDRTLTSPERIEQQIGVHFLGALPVAANKSHLRELMVRRASLSTSTALTTSRSAFSEAVLMLRTAVLFSSPNKVRTIAISSAKPEEGKSAVATNLAAAMVLHGARVLLIDADIRRPAVHRIFDVPNRIGLSSTLRDVVPPEQCIVPAPTPGLFLLPAGPNAIDASELLSNRFSAVLESLRDQYDFIVIDTPPLLGFVDSTAVGSAVDGVVLVVKAGQTPREHVQGAVHQLRRVRANILGLVLNQVSSSLSPYYAYYRYYYDRYTGSPAEQRTSQSVG